MSILANLNKKLSGLEIYNLDDPDSNIALELEVYATELERLTEDTAQMLDECFVESASDYGLSNLEEIFGTARDDLSTESRRQMLLKRMSLNNNDFTLDGIQKALESFNLEYTISEYPSYNRLVIIADTNYTIAQKEWIKAEVEKIIPSHLEFSLVFNSLSWEELEAEDLTFAAIDNRDLTWNEFDTLEN